MNYLTDEKLVIVGAAGMIGSNMLQTALMMKLSSNIVAYDSYAPGLEGAVEEMRHCSFTGAKVTFTTDVKEAFAGAKYIISSGGAARKAGMTREDLLKGNSEIAAQLGKDIKNYCPDCKHVTIIFNPADITGLVVLLESGLKPSQVTTLAALDSTRLQSALAQHFGIAQDKVTNTRTYGGHGEGMAVFASTAKIDGKPLKDLIGTSALTNEAWDAIKLKTVQGGKRIIDLRGRSSFQSPALVAIQMIAAAMGGAPFTWPSGVFVNDSKFQNCMMAMESVIDSKGVRFTEPVGTPEELASLTESYKHLLELRDEVISMGIIPAISEWKKLNPNL
ncbi:MAG: malate dehydrogenase [Rikenellaceae bacterium]